LPLTEADRKLLLDYSRRVLEQAVAKQPLPELESPPPNLQVTSGAFVTLRQSSGELRGCIGRVVSPQPLFQTVAECTVDAATYDPRFDPVTPEELPNLSIEISVLSPFEEARPEEVEVGRHGLLITKGAKRGVLLPQVPLEWGWDRERFLEETCVKAGLPANAWRQGARIYIFTADVFGESGNLTAEWASGQSRRSIVK
jgi:AmmeMemoRadiSam system protein A